MHNISVKIPGAGKISIPHYPIDMIAANERAASFTKRSIKNTSKLDALYLAVSMIDLTTLEGMDTPGKVKQLCGKAINPVPSSIQERMEKYENYRQIPKVGAVCVYPNMVPTAVECLKGSGIGIASVATAFPSGQLPIDIKLSDVKRAVKFGATEIDMVIDRGAFHCGEYQKVFDEIYKVKEVCGAQTDKMSVIPTAKTPRSIIILSGTVLNEVIPSKANESIFLSGYFDSPANLSTLSYSTTEL